MALSMKHTALAALVLLSSTLMVFCVRSSDRENEDSINPGVSKIVNVLEEKVLKTAMNKGVSVDDFLKEIFKKFKRWNEIAPKEDFCLDLKGWTAACTHPDGLHTRRAACQDFFKLEGMTSDDVISVDNVIDAVLGQGAEGEREEVLAVVWEKLTGAAPSDDSQDALRPDMLVCKKDSNSKAQSGLRQSFLDQMAFAAKKAGSPVTWEVFKAYYKTFKIKSHRHFLLMVVNAWHLMGGPVSPTPWGEMPYYTFMNTVNIRARIFNTGDEQGGKIVALVNDCGEQPGEGGMSKEEIVGKRLREQGEIFDRLDLSGKV